MSIQRISQIGAALFFLVLISGCASGGGGSADGGGAVGRDSQCRWNPRSCMYDGQYESGESDYAEQEAKRLNQAQTLRLQRHFVK
ncbi:hypothetical protein [Castellaniella sp. MT123]|uniref:hypothetical protein n=1 Tax=Castellaniella sp. MT123 TaxID=3140381 RepID=UPI0031F45293